MASIDSMKHKLADATRQLLVTKSSAVITGFMLKSAISLSVASILLGDVIFFESPKALIDFKKSEHIQNVLPGEVSQVHLRRFMRFGLAVGIFVLILFSSAFLARSVQKLPRMPERLKHMYTSGLALIPAWAYKDVVAAFIILMTKTSDTLDVDDMTGSTQIQAAIALMVAVLSSMLQIGLERLVDRISSEEGEAFEQTMLFSVMNSLKMSLGLGVGFAVNNVINCLVGGLFETVIVQLIYVLALSVMIPFLQVKIKAVVDQHKATIPVLEDKRWLNRTILFLVLSLQFVLGWAWKGLLTTSLGPLAGEGVSWQFLMSSTITFLGIFSNLGLALVNAPPHIVSLCALVAGMNIGWTWMDFAALCAGGAAHEPIGIAILWLYTLGTILLVSIAAATLEVIIQAFDKPEEMKELMKHSLDSFNV